MFVKIGNAVTGKGFLKRRTRGAPNATKRWRLREKGKINCSPVSVGIEKSFKLLRNEEKLKREL